VIPLVEKNGELISKIKVKAPEKPGKYCSFFQLRLDKKLKVGPKVFIEVEVVP